MYPMNSWPKIKNKYEEQFLNDNYWMILVFRATQGRSLQKFD